MGKPTAIKAGFNIAVSLVPGTAPKCCYIGRVQATDEYGVRINPVEWEEKLDVVHVHTEDMFFPWANISSMLVGTEEQPERRFVRDRAPAWQADIEALHSKTTGVKGK
ncbi:hypothetical protein ACFLW1_02505 [Chloroflexota bacterium]